MDDLDKEIRGIVGSFQPDFREPIVWPREVSPEIMEAIQESVNEGHPVYEAIGFQIEREGDAFEPLLPRQEPKTPEDRKAYWEYRHAIVGYGHDVPALLWTTRLAEDMQGDWRQHPEASLEGTGVVRIKMWDPLPYKEMLTLIRDDPTAFNLLERAYEKWAQFIKEKKKKRGPEEADITKRLVGWQAGIKRYKELYRAYQSWTAGEM